MGFVCGFPNDSKPGRQSDIRLTSLLPKFSWKNCGVVGRGSSGTRRVAAHRSTDGLPELHPSIEG